MLPCSSTHPTLLTHLYPHGFHIWQPAILSCDYIVGLNLISSLSGRSAYKAKMKFLTYHAWCKANNFESMLPEDTAECCNDEKKKLAQSSLDNHVIDLTHQKHKTHIVYTVHNWDCAVIHWMINTDQVCSTCILRQWELTLHDSFDMWGWNIEIERYLFLASL